MAQLQNPGDYITVVIKEDPGSDESEDIQCQFCNKMFANAMALRNHTFMEHIEQSDEVAVTNVSTLKVPRPKIKEEKIDQEIQNQEQDVDSMENSSITPLAAQNPKPIKIKKEKRTSQEIQKRKQEIIESMEPTSITSLAANNVRYIIVKSEDSVFEKNSVFEQKKRKKETKVKPKRSQSPQPITGPFECLETSALGVDGVCHQIFFSCCDYSQHARMEHAKRRRAARCQVCERPLPSAVGSAEPYVCETCGEGFESTEGLLEHISRKHMKAKPYQCSVCLKRFTQQGGVVQHMRMHTGQRPYPCMFCTKAFTQKSGLEQHIRTHTKDKPYRCVVCAKRFTQSVHLTQHMRTHTRLAPFHCPFCEKRFKQTSHLNYHLRYHDPATMTPDEKEVYARMVRNARVDSDGTRVHTQAQDEQSHDETAAAVEEIQAVETEILETEETEAIETEETEGVVETEETLETEETEEEVESLVVTEQMELDPSHIYIIPDIYE